MNADPSLSKVVPGTPKQSSSATSNNNNGDVVVHMTFTAGREGSNGYWAVYEDDRYGSTTAQGDSVEELLRDCDDAALCMVYGTEDYDPRLEFRIALAWTTEEQGIAYLLATEGEYEP